MHQIMKTRQFKIRKRCFYATPAPSKNKIVPLDSFFSLQVEWKDHLCQREDSRPYDTPGASVAAALLITRQKLIWQLLMPAFSLVQNITKVNEPWLLLQWDKEINQQKLQSNEQNVGNYCNQCLNQPFGVYISLLGLS